MTPADGNDSRRAPAVTVTISLSVIYIVALSIPLGVAAELGLAREQLTGWIVAIYGVPGALSMLLAWRTRQPLLITGNIFVLIFVASLGDNLEWGELTGASISAGAIVLALGWLGWTDRLARWLPAPIVYGVLAGAVLPFIVGMFDTLGTEQLLVGSVLLAYLAGRRFLEPGVPALLPALLVGLAVAAITGGVGAAPSRLTMPELAFTAPRFTFAALLTATPVIVVLITLQANAPSVVFLRDQGYEPPERLLTMASGAATMAASILGPLGVSLSLPGTALSAGPDAGARGDRYRAVIMVAVTPLVIALLAGYAADLEELIPNALLITVIGLAVLGVFTAALREVVAGPLVLGPVTAFAVAVSDLSLLGLGPFFWALTFGLGISRLVEREAWTAS